MNTLNAVNRILMLIILPLFSHGIYAEEKINIAYLKEGLADLNKSEKMIALQMWGEEVARLNKVSAEVFPIDSMDVLLRDVQLKKIHFALMNTGKFIMNYQKLQPYLSTDIYAVQRTTDLYEDYVIVVKKNTTLKRLTDLKRKRFSIIGNHLLQQKYLEYLLQSLYGQKPAEFFKQIRHPPTETQSVLDVFFGVSDGCTVPRHIFMASATLNPSIFEQLTIIHNSGPVFIPAVLVAFNYGTENMRKTFGKHLLESQFTVRGQQILDLFKINRIVQIDSEQLQPMFVFFEK